MALVSPSLGMTLQACRKTPGFFLIALVTLAAGVGATSAIFTVVNSVLLQPLPYPDPDRLVAVQHTAPGLEMELFDLSDGTYFIYRQADRSLEALGIYWQGSVSLAGEQEPERVAASGVTASVFALLEVTPSHGRVLQRSDEQPGAEPVVVLSDELWRRRFGGSPAAVGSLLRVDEKAHRIVGVMPAGFHFPEQKVDLWLPLRISPTRLNVGDFSYQGVARLRPGALPDEAGRELSGLVPRIADLPNSLISREMIERGQLSVLVHPLHATIVGEVERVLWLLLGSVGLILVIACANLANLFLVRAEGRLREVAVRSALGASRGDIVRLFLAESTALSLLGGVLGFTLAAAGVRLLLALQPEGIPRLAEIGVDGTVFAFTLVVALLAGSLVGLFAALRCSSVDLVPALKEGGRGGTAGRERLKVRNALVVVQIGLALVLLAGAGLMVKSFRQLRHVDPGIDPGGVLTLRLDLPEAKYRSAESTSRFVGELLARVRAMPGVQSAGTVTLLPLTGGGSNSGHAIEDFPLVPGTLPPVLATRWASPGYFETLRIPVREGKVFAYLDPGREGTEAVVSEALARRFWPRQSPLGKRLKLGLGADSRWCTIVGVVGNVRDAAIERDPVAAVYYSMQRRPGTDGSQPTVPRSFTLLVRGQGEPAALVGRVREVIWSLDPNLPLSQVRPMEDVAARSMVRTTVTMLLLVTAAAVALLLGAVGSYGVISYVVSQRTWEIGVRMALGATRWTIAQAVLWNGLVLAAAGIALGVAGATVVTRLMAALLYGVSPNDLPTFIAVSALLAVSVLFASYLPAQRAAAVQPLEAIRHE